MATRLVSLKLLDWADLLEDGNFFFEVALCEKKIWPEPDRWHMTVNNFMMLLAWEKNVDRAARLFPSARLQIVRDLYFVRRLCKEQNTSVFYACCHRGEHRVDFVLETMWVLLFLCFTGAC